MEPDDYSNIFYVLHKQVNNDNSILLKNHVLLSTEILMIALDILYTFRKNNNGYITLTANPADDKLMIFFIFFPKIVPVISCFGDSLHEMSKHSFWEISSAEFFYQHAKC